MSELALLYPYPVTVDALLCVLVKVEACWSLTSHVTLTAGWLGVESPSPPCFYGHPYTSFGCHVTHVNISCMYGMHHLYGVWPYVLDSGAVLDLASRRRTG
jgi:hypothetical protein